MSYPSPFEIPLLCPHFSSLTPPPSPFRFTVPSPILCSNLPPFIFSDYIRTTPNLPKRSSWWELWASVMLLWKTWCTSQTRKLTVGVHVTSKCKWRSKKKLWSSSRGLSRFFFLFSLSMIRPPFWPCALQSFLLSIWKVNWTIPSWFLNCALWRSWRSTKSLIYWTTTRVAL